MKKPVLGLDLDDVLMDFNRSLADWHNAHHGTSYCREDIVSYQLSELWGTTRDESVRRICEFYHSPEHAVARCMSGAEFVLPELEEQYEVVVISARPERARGETLAWLEGHFPTLVDKLHLTNRFDMGPELLKSEICKRLGVETFVDDAPMHHEDVSRVVTTSLLFEAPWNREYALGLPQNQRVRSWHDLGFRLAA